MSHMFGSFGDVNGWLQDAIGTGRLVNRVRGEVDLDPIDFAYLDHWRGVLSRIASLVAVVGS